MSNLPIPSITSTYGAWLISLFLETILYGIGLTQAFLYYHWWGTDSRSMKLTVFGVMVLETVQLCFFFRSSYFRFVERFGILQGDIVWSDSLQLFANYLSAFAVQLFFATRVYLRTARAYAKVLASSCQLVDSDPLVIRARPNFNRPLVGIYIVGFLAVLQMSAGTAQTILTYNLRSFSKLEDTAAVTTLQTASSLLCDILITFHLCFHLARLKTGVPTTERLLNGLMISAVNRGILTAVTSALTMGLFLAFPRSFWFFLSIAPLSKLYMNSMLATLNTRGHVWRKANTGNREWESIDLAHVGARETVSQVVFGAPRGSGEGAGHDGCSVTES